MGWRSWEDVVSVEGFFFFGLVGGRLAVGMVWYRIGLGWVGLMDISSHV